MEIDWVSVASCYVRSGWSCCSCVDGGAGTSSVCRGILIVYRDAMKLLTRLRTLAIKLGTLHNTSCRRLPFGNPDGLLSRPSLVLLFAVDPCHGSAETNGESEDGIGHPGDDVCRSRHNDDVDLVASNPDGDQTSGWDFQGRTGRWSEQVNRDLSRCSADEMQASRRDNPRSVVALASAPPRAGPAH